MRLKFRRQDVQLDPNGPEATAAREAMFEQAPDYPYASGMVNTTNIMFAARTAVEFMHDEQPDAVIAADRGGRIFAFASHYAWSKRYPGTRFPTRDDKIHLARLSAKELDSPDYDALVRMTLQRASVIDEEGDIIGNKTRDDDTVRVMLMDDWVYRGHNFGMFAEALDRIGVPRSNISVVTMCNAPMDGVNHAVTPAFQVWEQSAWKDNAEAVGVQFPDHPAVPKPYVSETSHDQRAEIIRNTNAYYAPFEKALQLGSISMCGCCQIAVAS